MSEVKKVPEIRFAGFSEPWEQRKLGDLSKRVIVGLATSVTPYYRGKGIPILRNLNIKENYLDDTDILYLDESYAESQISKQIHTGDVLTVHTGYIGTSCVVPEKYDNCLTFTTLITATDKLTLKGEFLAQYLNSEIGMSAVQAVTTQGGRQNLNTNDFVKVEIKYPSLPEQERICETLCYLDNLLTLHQRKYDKLVVLKKAMLEKMFPQDGNNVPEVRFAGFTGPWEQRKLGELALFNPKDELPKTFEYVDLESVVGIEMLSHRTEAKVSAPSRAQRLARTGDLFYQTVRPYQKNNYLFEKPDNNYVFSTGYAQMRPFVDGYFLLSLVQNESFVKIVLDSCTGTSYPAINANDLAEIEVFAPSDKNEAHKIGTIFRSLDNLITLHQRKYETLKRVKAALLQKMFV